MKRIITAREQWDMLSPWRTAMEWHSEPWLPGTAAGNDTFKLKDHLPSDYDFLNPGGTQPKYKKQMGLPLDPTGKWYHVSPHKLNPGDQIVPGGGQSPSSDFYGGDNWNRQYHVWMSPSVENANWWRDNWIGKDSYVYEVKPGDRPQPWNFSGNDGWVAPSATVTREITASVEEWQHDPLLGLLDPTGEWGYQPGHYEPPPPPPPKPKAVPIPGVPPGWERYYNAYKDYPDASDQAHVHVPTEILNHYMEYDRDVNDPQSQVLEKILREHGNQVRQPLIISTNGTHASLIEGNHRLALAKKLGIPHLPVKVYYDKRVNSNFGEPVPLEPWLKDWIGKNRDRLPSFYD